MSYSKYLCVLPLAFLGACAPATRSPGPAVQDGLALSRVELYRNGVGYFERTGKLQGNTLTLKVKDPAQFALIAKGDQIKAVQTTAIAIGIVPKQP